MDISRMVLQKQVDLEYWINLERFSVETPLLENNHLGEEDSAVAISIVSNSPLLSEGLLALLAPHLSLQLIGSYRGEFHSGLLPLNPPRHVILLDSGVGWTAAIAWTRYWRGLQSPAYVLLLELANDIDMILDCIEAGASGYTLQGASAVEVAEAITDTCSGVAHCSPQVTAQLYARVASLRAAVRQLSVSPLTLRESEILRYIANGYTNLEIAVRLVIELRTVKQHVHHILGKLNSRSRGEAVRLAANQGWLGEDLVNSE